MHSWSFPKNTWACQKISSIKMPSKQLNSWSLDIRCYCSFQKKYFSPGKNKCEIKGLCFWIGSFAIHQPKSCSLCLKLLKNIDFYSQCFLEIGIIIASPTEEKVCTTGAPCEISGHTKIILRVGLTESLSFGRFSRAASLLL